MGRNRVPFSFKKYQNSEYWFVAYYATEINEETGISKEVRRWKSTGETNKNKAILWAVKFLNQGGFTVEGKKPYWGTYFKDLYKGEKCPYKKICRPSQYPTYRTISSRFYYIDYINAVLKNVRIDNLKEKDIDNLLTLKWAVSETEEKSVGIHGVFNVLNVMFLIIKDVFKIDYSHYKKKFDFAKPKVKESIFENNFGKILNRDVYEKEIDWFYFNLLHLTGMRAGEALAFKNSLFQYDGFYYYKLKEIYDIPTQKIKQGTKTKEDRWIYIPLFLVDWIKKMGFSENQYIFKNRVYKDDENKGFLSLNNLNKKIKTIVKEKLNPDIEYSSHSARKSFRTYLTNKIDVNIADIALGHSLAGMRDVYIDKHNLDLFRPLALCVEQLVHQSDLDKSERYSMKDWETVLNTYFKKEKKINNKEELTKKQIEAERLEVMRNEKEVISETGEVPF